MDLTAAEVAEYDQQVAAIKDVLAGIVEAHKRDLAAMGETEAVISFSQGVLASMQLNPYVIANLMTIAVSRLARECQ